MMRLCEKALDALLDSVPNYTRLPGVRELCEACEGWASAGLSVQRIGASLEGRDIAMVSVGDGPLNALVVGTPHPNEPVGGLTIQYLVEALRANAAALADLPIRWHFIPTIEPDGLARNEGWLATPHDAQAYFRHFFRPAGQDQAEYTFPIDEGGYSFKASTPENNAWQRAIAEVKPDLLVSLHNADYFGAFFYVNNPTTELAAQLATLPARHGIIASTLPEPGADMEALSPAVWEAPDFRALVRASEGKFELGNSSFGFTKSMGTLGLVAEVPYWQPKRAAGQEQLISMKSRSQYVLAAFESAKDVLGELPEINIELLPPRTQVLRRAALEFSGVLTSFGEAVEHFSDVPAAGDQVELTANGCRMLALRAVSMSAQLCDELNDLEHLVAHRIQLETMAARGYAYLEKFLAEDDAIRGCIDVPLQSSVRLQVEAIVRAAYAVAGR